MYRPAVVQFIVAVVPLVSIVPPPDKVQVYFTPGVAEPALYISEPVQLAVFPVILMFCSGTLFTAKVALLAALVSNGELDKILIR